MQDRQSRTEEATPKKIRDAKKKGQVAKSGDLNAAVSLFVFTIMMYFLGRYLLTNTMIFLENSLNIDFSTVITAGSAGKILLNALMYFAILLFPFAAIAIITGIIINLIQTRFIFTVEPLKPDFKKLNPIEGFKNLVSAKSIFDLAKNLLKLIIVLFITYRIVSVELKKVLNANQIGSEKLFFLMIDLVRVLCINISIVILALAIIDYVFQSREFKKKLRMTKQEVKDEHKEMEGNPQIKSARQQKQRELAMSRMMSAIKESDVVITNPTHIAVVLRYNSKKDKAPIVTAKGVDYLAERIKKNARENKIPIIENKPVAQAMYKKVVIGEHVPVELYKAIAEILAVVYQMRNKNKGKI